VLSALALSALGFRSESFPPSRVVLAGVVAYFMALVGATTTFAVLNARDEQRKRDAEQAEAAATVPAGGEQTTTTTGTTTTAEAPQGGGETLKVSSPADGSTVFEPSKLTAKAGSVTIDYDNPSPVDHSIAIEGGGETLDESEIAADTTLTASADLEPGRFVYYCTVPGHREAGMVGTLTVE
jgi:plastocyanin